MSKASVRYWYTRDKYGWQSLWRGTVPPTPRKGGGWTESPHCNWIWPVPVRMEREVCPVGLRKGQCVEVKIPRLEKSDA